MQKIYVFLLFILLIGCSNEPPPTPTPNLITTPTNTIPTVTPPSTQVPTAEPMPSLAPTATNLPPTPTPNYPIHTGSAIDKTQVGVQIHIHQENHEAIFEHLRTLGVGWVKVQVSWKLYQPYPDQFSEERFAELDRVVQLAEENNISVLLGIAKAPEWSRPTTELDGPPSDYALYRTFTQFVAARYANRVAAYELWNEMNLQREWNGVPLSPTDFVQLVALGAEGVRAGDPTAVILSGAPAPTGINDGVTAVDDRVYFRTMLEAGLAAHVDGYGIHPYGWGNPPASTVNNPDPSIPTHNNHPSFFFQDTVQDYVNIMQTLDVAKPLWTTEFGWGSFENVFNETGQPANPPAGVEFMAQVNEWQQAEYTADALAWGQERPFMGPMILWNLNFGQLLGYQFSETGFGILRPDGTPRPVYQTLRHLP